MLGKAAFIALFLVCACQKQDNVYAEDTVRPEKLDDTFVIMAESKENAEQLAESLGCELICYDNNVASIKTTEEIPLSSEEVMSQAESVGIDVYEEFVYYADDYTSPYGNIPESQWYAPYVGLPDAWKYSKGAGVRVAVIDSGIDLTHPELISSIEDATSAIADEYYDSTSSTNIHFDSSYKGPKDNFSHGTHVSGIIAAADDNNGVVGVAPECKIISIKAIEKTADNKCLGTTSMLVSAIKEAVSRNVDIINLSVGGAISPPNDMLLSEAVKSAVDKGITVVCAAGNNGTSATVYPAAFEDTIGVSSLKTNNESELTRLESSRYGFWVDISAPGYKIYSTVPGEGYDFKSGTSMATPIVSGAVALCKSMKHNLTLAEIQELMYSTATDLGTPGRDDYYGYGAVNMEKMVTKLYNQLHVNDNNQPDEPNHKEQNNSANEGSNNENVSQNIEQNLEINYNDEVLLMPDDGLIHAQGSIDSLDSGKHDTKNSSDADEKKDPSSIDLKARDSGESNDFKDSDIKASEDVKSDNDIDNIINESIQNKEIILTNNLEPGTEEQAENKLTLKETIALIAKKSVPIAFGIELLIIIFSFFVVVYRQNKDK